MYFDEDEEKKLFEDLQFKRRVVFIDDDVNEVTLKHFSKQSATYNTVEKGCQVKIQNEITSTQSQTRPKKNKECQTEIEDEIIQESSSDLKRLTKILDRRGHLIENAIEENIKSTLFSNYDVDWTDGGNSTTNPFTLVHQQLMKEEELQITGLKWNSTGSTIFVGYGRYDHESVCTHKAAFCTWNIDRLKLNPNKPDMVFETSFCISSLAAHPEYPSIVAIGFFNGEIQVHNVRETETLAAVITDKREMHKDEVTSLRWIKDSKTSKKKFLLMSGSKDGKILIWYPQPAKTQLKLVDGYRMLIDHLPNCPSRSRGVEMGVSSISINNEDKETFVTGCDSGGLFKCSLLSEESARTRWEDDFPIDLKSAVSLAFNPQYGPIYSISSSPFHRNLILTCGTDTEVKLYSLLQTSSLISLCPDNGYLYSIDWSPTRPCVFACGSHKGNILIYDLAKTGSNLSLVLHASEKPIHIVSFNEQRPGFLVSGDRNGVVKVWRLANELSKIDSHELKQLNDISEKPFQKV